MIPNLMMSSSFPPSNITTEQIQKFLDENKQLILAIMNNQNLGKLAECAQYQALLQKNLMYLAAIADAQPPTPTLMPSQLVPHPGMQQQGGFYIQQHPQAAVIAQQPPGFPQAIPALQLNSQPFIQTQMGVGPGYPMHSETGLRGGQPTSSGLTHVWKVSPADAGTDSRGAGPAGDEAGK